MNQQFKFFAIFVLAIILTVNLTACDFWNGTGIEEELDETKAGKVIADLDAHEGEVYSLDFSSDNSMLVSGGADNMVRLWEIDEVTGDYDKMKEFTHDDSVHSVNFTPDDEMIVSTGGWDDETVKIWDVDSGQEIVNFTDHNKGVKSAGIASEGNKIVSGSVGSTPTGVVAKAIVWEFEPETGEYDTLTTFEEHDLYPYTEVTTVEFCSQDEKVVSGDWKKSNIKIWDAESGDIEKEFTKHEGAIRTAKFISGDGYIVSASDDSTIKLWDTETGEVEMSYTDYGGSIRAADVSEDDSMIVAGNTLRTEGHPKILQAETGEVLVKFTGQKSIYSINFSAGDEMVASGSTDGDIKIWEW